MLERPSTWHQPITIPEGTLGSLESLRELTSWQSDSSLSLEWVELKLDLNTTEQDELMLVLVSPSGTRSVVMAPGGGDSVPYNGQRIFRTNQFWGESGLGQWRLEALDVRAEARPDSQTIANASLDLYGTCDGTSPLQVKDFAEIKAVNGSLENLAHQLLQLGGAPAGSYRLDAVKQLGQDNSFGQFSGGTASQLQVDQGLIFSTGKAKDAVGPNHRTNTTTIQGTPGHPLHGSGASDSSGLEIRFTPNRDFLLQWKAQFGSEEFQEYSPSQYDDHASLFLASVKSASEQLTPQSGAIDLLQGPAGRGYSVNDFSITPAVYAKYATANPACGSINWEYDGGSRVPAETQQISLKANRTYVLAPIVSDVGDAAYDSGLILGRSASPAPAVKLRVSTAKAFEGDWLTLAASNLKPNANYQWRLSGNGVRAEDFKLPSLSGFVTSNAEGIAQQIFKPAADGLREGPEAISIELLYQNQSLGTPAKTMIFDSQAF